MTSCRLGEHLRMDHSYLFKEKKYRHRLPVWYHGGRDFRFQLDSGWKMIQHVLCDVFGGK
jgi:hypothetical protein